MPAPAPAQHIEHADQIIHETCLIFGFTRMELLGRRRSQTLVWARHAAIEATCNICENWSAVARMFQRDNATVHYAMKHMTAADTKATAGVLNKIRLLRRRVKSLNP